MNAQARLGEDFENPKVSTELREAGERLRSIRRSRLQIQAVEADAKATMMDLAQKVYDKDPENEIFTQGFTVEVDGEIALIEPEVVNGVSNIKTSKVEDTNE